MEFKLVNGPESRNAVYRADFMRCTSAGALYLKVLVSFNKIVKHGFNHIIFQNLVNDFL